MPSNTFLYFSSTGLPEIFLVILLFSDSILLLTIMISLDKSLLFIESSKKITYLFKKLKFAPLSKLFFKCFLQCSRANNVFLKIFLAYFFFKMFSFCAKQTRYRRLVYKTRFHILDRCLGKPMSNIFHFSLHSGPV